MRKIFFMMLTFMIILLAGCGNIGSKLDDSFGYLYETDSQLLLLSFDIGEEENTMEKLDYTQSGKQKKSYDIKLNDDSFAIGMMNQGELDGKDLVITSIDDVTTYKEVSEDEFEEKLEEFQKE